MKLQLLQSSGTPILYKTLIEHTELSKCHTVGLTTSGLSGIFPGHERARKEL